MKPSRTEVLDAAMAEALLPGTVRWPELEERPWPVTLLTAFGAWLAFWPLLGVVALTLGDVLVRGVGTYIAGLLVLGGAVAVLRQRSASLFVEQLAVPALLVGGGCVAFGLLRDFDDWLVPPLLLLLALAVGVAMAVRRPWLQTLLGMLACGLAGVLMSSFSWGQLFRWQFGLALWLPVHVLFSVWCVAMWAQARFFGDAARASVAALAEALGAGWLAAVLVALAAMSGSTFLLPGFGAGDPSASAGPVTSLVSVVLVAASAAVGARAWPALRQPWLGGVWAVLMGLAWFLPLLGATVLALLLTATTQRWRLALLAAVAAAWIIGSFYYQLAWPLATKALVLAGAGGVLGGLAWGVVRLRTADPSPTDLPAPQRVAGGRRAAVAIAMGGVLTLLVANGAIWQKEQLIAHGDKTYVPLMPVDPRSLMQGDFMALEFLLPSELRVGERPGAPGERAQVVATRDARGVATVLRLRAPGAPLAAGEFPIELTPRGGRWHLVTDAWYFREGEGERWAQAKFGEFRIMPDGRALLVGMADANLQPIQP